MRKILAVSTAGTLSMLSCLSYGQDAASSDKYVSKEEYLKLSRENEKLQEEMKEMRAFKAQMQDLMQKGAIPAPAVSVPGTASTNPPAFTAASGDLARQVMEARDMAKLSFPGTDKFLMTGYGSAGFTARHGEDKLFSATFNPIFLWKLSDRIFFEGEIEMELEGHDTSTALELAQISYVANDYMTFGAGKFLNPMNSFVERYHMAWVNRLPDKPLAVYDGLLPETFVGAQVRGGIPVGPTKFNYSVFAGNAPELNTDISDPAGVGTLTFDNFDNTGGHIAAGAHLGFQPIPAFEVGYGFMVSQVGPKGSDVQALLQSVDLSYVQDSEMLRGLLRLNAQWVWSHVQDFAYDPSVGPFNNNRHGGYAQVAYRPTKLHPTWLSKFEPVFRYDMFNQSRTPVAIDETRCTVGLNYWLGPSTVIKAAYQFDEQHGGSDQNAWLIQFATGF